MGLIQHVLRKAGFSFKSRVVETSEEYIQALHSYEPELILSDHSLPQFNSWEALKIARKMNVTAPFILVTGSVSEEFAVECMKLGADDYILKSSLLRLPASVNNNLSKRATEQEVYTVKQLNEKLVKAYHDLALAHNEIKSSIKYATQIQSAIFCNMEMLGNAFPESFILYRPKDIVSGDFYWFADYGDRYYIAVVDCTGHGVPGAFMSILGTTLLNKIVVEAHTESPATILELLDKSVRNILGLEKEDGNSETRDGMDIALCCVNRKTYKVEFAGANRSLFYFNNQSLDIARGDRRGIGGHNLMISGGFTHHELSLQPGCRLYMFTDGYADQIGGTSGKKMLTKKFLDFLHRTQDIGMAQQSKYINHFLNGWKGDGEQTDDILVLGVQL